MQTFRKAASVFASAMPLILLCLNDGMLHMAGAIVLHECAHLVALWLCHGRVRSFRAAPFGLCIAYDENSLSLGREILVTAAGAIVNFAAAGISVICYALWRWDLLLFGMVNALVGGMNLLPMEPLDGARLLRLLLSLRCTPDRAVRITQGVTYLFSFLLFLIASYLLLTGVTGIYLLLFTVYIFSGCAWRLSESQF